jgi:hypothetical protein
VTNKAKMLAILPAFLSFYMLFMGISAFRSFHPLDSSRYTFGLPPICIAVAILVTLVAMPRRFCKGSVHVRDTGIEFNPGDHDLNVNFPWNDLIFAATQNKQQMIRTLVLVHRDRKMVFYDIFTQDFDLLVAAITRRKSKSAQTQADGGLKIDSGKIGHLDRGMTGR